MKYRTLGNTGLSVSEVGFGTIPILQGSVPVLPEYFNLDEGAALVVLEHAFRLGCNLYDTAIVPEYGDAEIKLGKFATHIGREQIIISDKARFYDGNEMYQAVVTSNENLGTYADLYFVHQVDGEHEEAVFGKGGALDALVELKQEGRIRFAGVASHYYDTLLRGAEDPRVDVLQGSGNLLERGMLERIKAEPLFRAKGILVNKVYAAGLLPGLFPTEILLRSVLSYPVSCALVGIGTVEQADAAFGQDSERLGEGSLSQGSQQAGKGSLNQDSRWTRKACFSQDLRQVERMAVYGEMAEEEIPSFEEALSVLEKAFNPIACDRCQRCVCPCGTEIHTLFRQYLYFFLGKEYWALRKLELGIEESAARCRQCTDMPCLAMCPRTIRIPDEIQKIWRLVRKR